MVDGIKKRRERMKAFEASGQMDTAEYGSALKIGTIMVLIGYVVGIEEVTTTSPSASPLKFGLYCALLGGCLVFSWLIVDGYIKRRKRSKLQRH